MTSNNPSGIEVQTLEELMDQPDAFLDLASMIKWFLDVSSCHERYWRKDPAAIDAWKKGSPLPNLPGLVAVVVLERCAAKGIVPGMHLGKHYDALSLREKAEYHLGLCLSAVQYDCITTLPKCSEMQRVLTALEKRA